MRIAVTCATGFYSCILLCQLAEAGHLLGPRHQLASDRGGQVKKANTADSPTGVLEDQAAVREADQGHCGCGRPEAVKRDAVGKPGYAVG
jgi:hypothetical protein